MADSFYPVISPSRSQVLTTFFLVRFLREVHGRVTAGHRLEEESLSASVGHEVERSHLLQVDELIARCPVHVYLLVVMDGVEILSRFGSLALETDVELAEVAQHDFLSVEQHLTHAVHRLSQHGLDVCTAVHGAMRSNVLAEFAHRNVFGYLW